MRKGIAFPQPRRPATPSIKVKDQLPKMDLSNLALSILRLGGQIPRDFAKVLINSNPRKGSLVSVAMRIREFMSKAHGARDLLLLGTLADAVMLSEIYVESLLKERMLKENRKIHVVCGENARITRQINGTIISIAFDVVPNEENPIGFSGLTMVISFDNAMKMGSGVKFQCFLGKPK